MKQHPEISVVSPVYMAENNIDNLVRRIRESVSVLTDYYEIILVEDNSADNSWQKVKENCKKYVEVKGLKLSRNYGQQYAIQAGLDVSKGDYVVTMDCDLQDQPEEIVKLFTKAKGGVEIVAGIRKNRKDSIIAKALSFFFYKTLSYLTETKQDERIANFAMYHRKVIQAMASFNDYNRYYPMLQQIVGFSYAKVDVEHSQREDGQSSYSLKKKLQLALNIILTFSDKPLRLTVKLGVLISFFSICAALTLVIMYFLGEYRTRGWASLALLLSFFSGAIISVLGMVGLYVGKTFESVKNRPTYIIQDMIE